MLICFVQWWNVITVLKIQIIMYVQICETMSAEKLSFDWVITGTSWVPKGTLKSLPLIINDVVKDL